MTLDDLYRWVIAGGAKEMMIAGWRNSHAAQKEGEYKMQDVVKAYEDANQTIKDVQTAYNKTLDSFRSNIKNDLASIGAAAARVQAEAGKMGVAYSQTAALLTSPEMQIAIENAERLAKALGAISELQSHSITFAVLDKKTASIQP